MNPQHNNCGGVPAASCLSSWESQARKALFVVPSVGGGQLAPDLYHIGKKCTPLCFISAWHKHECTTTTHMWQWQRRALRGNKVVRTLQSIPPKESDVASMSKVDNTYDVLQWYTHACGGFLFKVKYFTSKVRWYCLLSHDIQFN